MLVVRVQKTAMAVQSKDDRLPYLREQAMPKGNAPRQPIESAPKDGTPVLVSNPTMQGSWVAKWLPAAVSGYRFGNPWFGMMLNHDHMPEGNRYGTPTHWMPLPKPPEIERATAQKG